MYTFKDSQLNSVDSVVKIIDKFNEIMTKPTFDLKKQKRLAEGSRNKGEVKLAGIILEDIMDVFMKLFRWSYFVGLSQKPNEEFNDEIT